MKSNSSNNSVKEIIRSEINESAALLTKVILPSTSEDIEVFLKREDLVHPFISGNKWRKLKYNLIEAEKQNYKTLLTFGGAYSNHIHATAYAGKVFGFKTIGIIRGEEHLPLNPTLSDARSFGMEIQYVTRGEYRRKKESEFIKSLVDEFGDFYLVPEGGTNQLAIKGCTEIIDDIVIDFDIIMSACGTGGTISGIISALNGNKKIIGVPVLKGADFLKNEIEEYVKEFTGRTFTNWKLALDFHHGGYAKITKDLLLFIAEFEKLNQISLDPVYTGKLMYAINSMIESNEFPKGTKIIALHTGGLQGIKGMQNKMDKLLS